MHSLVLVLMVLVCFNFILKQTWHKKWSVAAHALAAALFTGFMWPFAIEQSRSQIDEWLSNPDLSLEVAAFAEGYKYFGLYMVIFYAALISVPQELEEAARIDGAGMITQLLRIKLPYIKPVIISNLILVLNGSMRSFDVSYLLTKGGPANTSQLLTPYMYKQAFNSLKYGYGSAVAITIVVLCVLLGVVLQKLIIKDDKE